MPSPITASPVAHGARRTGRVDVHHHFFPPEYVTAVTEWRAKFSAPPAGRVPKWSADSALEEMDKTGTQTAVLSMTSPGVYLGEVQAARRMARCCNEYAADLGRRHTGRFGLFASLPMPDVDASLAEIAYAFDVLKANGVGMMTNFGDKWPGDAAFAPVFDELDRRHATVFFHPHTPHCCAQMLPGVPDHFIEWPYDTGRAIVSLLFSGTLARCRNIRFIFSHAGGTVPMLAGRIRKLATRGHNRIDLSEIAPQGIEHELTRLFYDTTSSGFAPTMAALRAFVPTRQILFGSDFPFYTIAENLAELSAAGLSAEEIKAIDSNAAALI